MTKRYEARRGDPVDPGDPLPPARPPCACSGVRWCASCRVPAHREAWGLRPVVRWPACLEGGEVSPGMQADGSRVAVFDPARQAAPDRPDFAGVVVWRDFVSEPEAARLLDDIESFPFVPAQSGKLKQHFGARANFRKQRLQSARFEGLPAWAGEIEARVRQRVAEGGASAGLVAALSEYVTTDAFVLRYDAARQSNLDAHVDDTWAYGELILDLSLEQDGFVTFLDADPQCGVDHPFSVVRVPLPARSLALIHGPARYDWWHGIRAADIVGRRTSITLRTLGSSLRSTDEGRDVMERAARVLVASQSARPGRGSAASWGRREGQS